MKKEKEKDLSEYSEVDKLTYFRWKALIRSKEYENFYREADVKNLLQEKESIESEIFDIEYDLITAEPEGSTSSPSIEDLLENIGEFGGNPSGITNDEVEEYREVIFQKQNLEDRENEIIAEAGERFGLIVWDLDDLEPIDKPIDILPITFRDYIPGLPKGQLRKIYENDALREINVAEFNSIKPYLNSGYKLFLVNTEMPIGFISETLKQKIRPAENLRRQRKDFNSWEEAFKAWDSHKKTKNLYKTAKLMRYKTNRKSELYSKEDLRSLIKSKLNVAEELISLAGKGHFKAY